MKTTADLWRDLNELARPLLGRIQGQTSRVWGGHRAQKAELRAARKELKRAQAICDRLLGGPYNALLDEETSDVQDPTKVGNSRD